jgi:hypothetical protein
MPVQAFCDASSIGEIAVGSCSANAKRGGQLGDWLTCSCQSPELALVVLGEFGRLRGRQLACTAGFPRCSTAPLTQH